MMDSEEVRKYIKIYYSIHVEKVETMDLLIHGIDKFMLLQFETDHHQ